MRARNSPEGSPQRPEAAMEVFEVTPVMLGGSPTDPSNKVLLTREEHIAAVRYWNGVIRELRQLGPVPDRASTASPEEPAST